MAVTERGQRRKQAVSELKRGLILEAAQRVFEREGLEGASLRAIAGEAGYTPAALYFHFDSKEAIYADLLARSLSALHGAVEAAVTAAGAKPRARLHAAGLAFFDFYAENPRDLDLGFYLFKGGMRPHGLGSARNRALNAALEASLQPIAEAARELGADKATADLARADLFAYASGLLLLAHTRRIRLFEAAPRVMMQRHLERLLRDLTERKGGAGKGRGSRKRKGGKS